MKIIYRYTFTDKNNSFLTVYADCYENATLKASNSRGIKQTDVKFYSVEEMFSMSDT